MPLAEKTPDDPPAGESMWVSTERNRMTDTRPSSTALVRDEAAARAETLADERITRLLGTRRASITFAAIVFLTMFIQVEANPFVALIGGQGQWSHPLPLVVVALIVAAGSAAQAATLLWSVRHPALAVLGALACYLAMVLIVGVPNWLSAMQVTVAIALFLLSSRSTLRTAIGWLALTVAIAWAGLIGWVASAGVDPVVAIGFVLSQSVAFAAPATGATALGAWWGVRSRRIARAQALAEAATREHEERIAQARLHERTRIAQELHDVAAQHIAGLLALTDAALTLAHDEPARALDLVADVRTEGRFASASLYGALRDLRAVDGPPAEATPDLMLASELIGYWRRRGVQIEWHALGDLAETPAVVSTTAYRGIQEALTNAVKHAPGAPIRVHAAFDGVTLRISVENGPVAGTRDAEAPSGLGWGLDGLRERLRLLGGTVEAGPTPGGGWRVRMEVTVPANDSTAAPVDG